MQISIWVVFRLFPRVLSCAGGRDPRLANEKLWARCSSADRRALSRRPARRSARGDGALSRGATGEAWTPSREHSGSGALASAVSRDCKLNSHSEQASGKKSRIAMSF